MSNSSANPKSDVVRLSVTLFVIAAVMALLVALVNNVTASEIERRNAQKLSDGLKVVMSEATEFEPIKYGSEYVMSSDNKKIGIDGVWNAKKDGDTIGYCVKVSPKGYGGAIETIVAIDVSGSIVNTQIVSMSETSGIGTKIKEDGFLSQFPNKTSSGMKDVQTISGATRSSSAFLRGVNAALKVALECNGGEWNE